MKIVRERSRRLLIGIVVLALVLFVVGCGATSTPGETAASEPTAAPGAGAETAETDEHEDEREHEEEGEHEHEEEGEHEHEGDHEHDAAADMLILPELAAAELNGDPLRVVATTSIIGDVVAQVGGEAIALTTLMEPGQDPHSYEPAARQLTAVADAHVIFVNGWNLEEGLSDDLETIGENAPIVPISANIEPLAFGEGDPDHEGEEHEEDEAHQEDEAHEHDHSGVDPHVWFSIHNVEQWVENAEQILSDLDPANAATYQSNAAAYLADLEELEEYADAQLSQIPEENRDLVTNHGAFSYFAHEYDFSVLGTVIPGMSTMAEPSASDLADLIGVMEEHDACVIFTETTVSDTLAQTAAAELDGCDEVQVLELYTGAVGPAGSGADSYIGMFRANVDAVVAGLAGTE